MINQSTPRDWKLGELDDANTRSIMSYLYQYQSINENYLPIRYTRVVYGACELGRSYNDVVSLTIADAGDTRIKIC